MLTAGTAGIAAHNYSQVHQFPFRAAYDDYYDRAVDIGEVGVPEFADLVQGLLVDYIRAKYGEQAPDYVLPEPGMPSSSDDDFQVDTHLASDRMPD